jgi:ribose transport system ATP-binding protein
VPPHRDSAPNSASRIPRPEPLHAPLLELRDISKRYGGVQALDRVRFVCRSGRIHALLGENGAGKSTLIKVMAGVVQPDAGRLLLGGVEHRFNSPRTAQTAGIACIFQELSLVPSLSVADNLALLNPPRRFGLIDDRAQRRFAEQALARVGAEDIHPLAPVASLSLSRRQIVEIAKALVREPRVLILDEATSALMDADVRRVMRLLSRLRDEGLAIVYISHRLSEVRELADECTVFRNGRHVESFEAGAYDDEDIVELMLGEALEPPVRRDAPARESEQADVPALEVRGLRWRTRLRDVDLDVRRGEIVGLGGVDGQGQGELLLALFGVLRGVEGRIAVDGKPMRPSSPRRAKRRGVGMALVPEDRKVDGLMLEMSVRDNLTLSALDDLALAGVISGGAEARATAELLARLSIRASDSEAPVSTLSGGNQQKVVIGKWLLTQPRILLLNDPTRGIDVGTKQEIHELFDRLARAGVAIVLYSTDYGELVRCCDRVAVLHDGRVARVLERDELSEHALLSAALNVPARPAELGPMPEAGPR